MATRIAFFLFLLFQLSQTKVLQLSCAQIREFVDGHNADRLKIAKGEVPNQPAASLMKSVTWDIVLADKASKWASKNNFSHNPDRVDGSRRFTVGENIFKVSSTNANLQLDIPSAISAWFNEHKDYKYGPISPSDFDGSKKAVGHLNYTQVVWSNSIYLGCGVSQNRNGKMMEYLVVCNYGPAGNFMGFPPYKIGTPINELMCAKDCRRPYGVKCQIP